MTSFVLKRVKTHPHQTDTYRILTTLEDGYVLDAGGISRDTGAHQRVFWAWSCIKGHRPTAGHTGQEDTRELALAAFRRCWETLVTPQDIQEVRTDAEWTDEKYTIWDVLGKDAFARGAVRCVCGDVFDAHQQDLRKIHVPHLKAKVARASP